MDYVKCLDRDCPSRSSCYRFYAPAGHGQAYSDYKCKDGDIQCTDFLSDPTKAKSMLGGQRGGKVTRSKKQQSWAWRG